MDQQRKREIQVGVTTIVAIVIVIGGLMFFKNMRLDSGNRIYAADFAAVEGLKIGDRVQVRGIRSGSVTGFDFLPEAVRVSFELAGNIPLREGATIVLMQKGIVGEVALEIDPGVGEVVPDGHVFDGQTVTSMLALGDKVDVSLEEFTLLAKDLRLILSQLQDEGQMVGVLTTARRTLEELDGSLRENRADMRRVVRNIADLTATLETAFNDGKLDSTLQTARRTTARLDSTAVELTALTREGRALIAGLEAGEGTAGRLLKDEALYDRADSTLQSLDRLLDQMRRDPKHFFKVSVF